MPIYQKNDALTNDQKKAVKDWLKKFIKTYHGDFPFELTAILNEEIEKISKSTKINVIEFSIYLEAVSKHLKLEQARLFDKAMEHKLLAALRYFIETLDVIPDWEAEGYDDDIYCLNVALKALPKHRLKQIETSVKTIKKNKGFNSGS